MPRPSSISSSPHFSFSFINLLFFFFLKFSPTLLQAVALYLRAHCSLGCCLYRGLLQVSGGLLQVEVALLVGSSGPETGTQVRGPGSSLEQENGEDDAESETEGGLDEEVGEAAIPLLVEKRFADGPGNGAWGARGGGLGHGEQTFRLEIQLTV